MTTTNISSTPLSLRGLFPRTRTWDAVLVVGFSVLTALCAQIYIPLGFTPVPISGQTFAVLLSGAVLGAKLGAGSQLLYVLVGAIGFPVFQSGEGGWSIFVGSTGGYLVGFIVASYVVGYLTEKTGNHQVLVSIFHFVIGSLIIYIFGALWLSYFLSIPIYSSPGEPSALAFGVVPFLVGDAIKIMVAGLLLPSAWKTIKYSKTRN